MRQTRPLVLASASPRRRELLTRLGLTFEITPADLVETQAPGEAPEAYVTRLAREKAGAIAARLGTREAAVLGADTTVVLDGAVLNKPADLAESERMLRALSGREHVVHTGVAVLLVPEPRAETVCVSTRVRFRALSDATIRGYVATREGLDKAGAYGIQDLGAALVERVEGSYTNVVGLPAAETITLLEALGVLAEWP